MEIKGRFVAQDVIAFLVPWVIGCAILGETLACQIVWAGVCCGGRKIRAREEKEKKGKKLR